jgi:hypothetical protein
MPSSPKPGGCLFAIYRADGMPQQKLAKCEFEFALFAQHMLILSALNEARLNLIRHNDALRTQSLEKFTHFIKPELRHIRSLYASALAAEKNGHKDSSYRFERRAGEVLGNLLGIVDFAEQVATGRASDNQSVDFEKLESDIQDAMTSAGDQALELLRLDVKTSIKNFSLTYETSRSALPAVGHIKLYDDPAKIFPAGIAKRERYVIFGPRALEIAIGELVRNALRYALLQNNKKKATWTLLKTGDVLNLVVINKCENNIAKLKKMAVFFSDEYINSNAISHLRLCIAGSGIKEIPKRPELFIRSTGSSSEKERVEVIWVLPIGRTIDR